MVTKASFTPHSTIQLAYIAAPVSVQCSGEVDLDTQPVVGRLSRLYLAATLGCLNVAGHDLNAFGHGIVVAPLSVRRSYDIPADFLGTHRFPSVQVFSVCKNSTHNAQKVSDNCSNILCAWCSCYMWQAQ